MKVWSSLGFFLLFSILLGVGAVMASSGKGVWLLVVSFVAYLVLFVRKGCMGT